MVLFKKTDYNTKITEIEDKLPDISNLATKTALTNFENKIPSISHLVKKADCKINLIIIIIINILILQSLIN